MAPSAVPHTNLVAGMLARHWHITEPALRTNGGVSRATWRIGSLFWLSQAEQARSAELSRQAKLLFDLNRYLKREYASLSVPQIVPNGSGSLVVVDAGYAWLLTRNLPGDHPDAADPNMYSALVEGLACFHRALRGFPESQPVRACDGISMRARQCIARFDPDTFIPFTATPREKELLEEAGAWLLPRLEWFEQLPRQLVHGDWTPRNVLFDRIASPHRLTGVLDFEAMAWDPRCVDVAHTCSTLLMWSGLDNLDQRIAAVLDMYERFAAAPLELSDIHTAMLAHWLCHYWSWRDRLQDGEFGHEVRERLCLRISSVLSYVSRP